ncbi:MAG: hypothetical protein JSW62_00505, partial [Thermoplasmatales archaeon]
MKKGDILELETRREIYNFILKYPGLHLRKLCGEMNTPKTTMKYHLNYLKKHSFVIEKVEGRYTRYYVTNNISNIDKKLINIIRQRAPREIILYLLICTCASQAELSRGLEK